MPCPPELTHAEVIEAFRSLDSFIDITEDDLRRLVDLLSLRRVESGPDAVLDAFPPTSAQREQSSRAARLSADEDSDRGDQDEGEAEAELGEAEASGGNRRTAYPGQLQHRQHDGTDGAARSSLSMATAAMASSTATAGRRRFGGCCRHRGADERSGRVRTGSNRRRGPRARTSSCGERRRSVVGDDDPRRSRRDPHRPASSGIRRRPRPRESNDHSIATSGAAAAIGRTDDQPARATAATASSTNTTSSTAARRAARRVRSTQRSWRTSIETSSSGVRTRKAVKAAEPMEHAATGRRAAPAGRTRRWGPISVLVGDHDRSRERTSRRSRCRGRGRGHRVNDEFHPRGNQDRGPDMREGFVGTRCDGCRARRVMMWSLRRGGAWVSSRWRCRVSLPSASSTAFDGLFRFTKWGIRSPTSGSAGLPDVRPDAGRWARRVRTSVPAVFVFGYDEVQEGCGRRTPRRHWSVSCSCRRRVPQLTPIRTIELRRRALINDAPDHTRLRAAVSRLHTAQVDRYEPLFSRRSTASSANSTPRESSTSSRRSRPSADPGDRGVLGLPPIASMAAGRVTGDRRNAGAADPVRRRLDEPTFR